MTTSESKGRFFLQNESIRIDCNVIIRMLNLNAYWLNNRLVCYVLLYVVALCVKMRYVIVCIKRLLIDWLIDCLLQHGIVLACMCLSECFWLFSFYTRRAKCVADFRWCVVVPGWRINPVARSKKPTDEVQRYQHVRPSHRLSSTTHIANQRLQWHNIFLAFTSTIVLVTIMSRNRRL